MKRSNVGDCNVGDYNTGDYNTGDYNTGNRNTGSRNTGNRNTGICNTGNFNTGNYNTGRYNIGRYNIGSHNTGDFNTGDYNTGDCNTGDFNTGHYNTGSYNTGNRNTGSYNTGDCNTNTPTVRLFNKDSGWEFNCEKHILFRRVLGRYLKSKCVWVYDKDMSVEEKKNHPSYKTTGGYLKVLGTMYNGVKVTDEHIKFFESVPNFCPNILKECTGIVFSNTRKIVIDGKEIEISEESFNQLKKSLIV